MSALFKDTTTYDPIFCLLNVSEEEERDKLTTRWVDNKLEELNFIGIVGALLAGVLTSTGSWPSILPNGTRSPWTVRACWYCGILFALVSVLISAHQSIRLHRLRSHTHPNTSIRRLLSKKGLNRQGKRLPRRTQVYMWQLAGIILSFAVLCMLGGMFILIWSSTGNLSEYEKLTGSWWNSDAKLAVTFSTVGFVLFLIFVTEQWTMYSFQGKDDGGQADEANHGESVDEDNTLENGAGGRRQNGKA